MTIVEPLNLMFKDLTYTVIDEKESKLKNATVEKTILNNLTGYFRHGRLTAIMGPSGAGKTSLLEVISKQSKSGIAKGNLYLNGNKVDIKTIKQFSGFVFQEDVILNTMTVKEALFMSAYLRLPEEMSMEEKMKRVDNMISLLHLEKCKDTIVGDSLMKGISGGEKKRLSVGMEMIMNPSIIFLDEPTTGLDSYSAYSLVNNLKDLASTGRTVITTIHQPSSEILGLFDDLILLYQGKIVYQGEMKNLVNYFSGMGYKCPEYSNPTDFLFMNVFNNEKINNSIDCIDYYKTSGMEKQVLNKFNLYNSEITTLTEKNKRYFPSLCIQICFLFKRYLINLIRNKTILGTRIFQAIGLGLLDGLTFLNLPSHDDKSQVQDRNGSLFTSSFSQVLVPIIGSLALFSLERPIAIREITSGYYGVVGYYLSKMIIEIPIQIILTLLTTTIIYWLVLYQKKLEKYLIFVGVIELGSLCGLSIGTAIATASENVNFALQFAPFLILPLILFSGLLINADNIPPYFTWIQYLSPIRYMYQEVYKNEFKGLKYKGQDLEYNIDNMSFNKISTTLALCLLAGITLILLVSACIILFISIQRTISKTKYLLNNDQNNNNNNLNNEETQTAIIVQDH